MSNPILDGSGQVAGSKLIEISDVCISNVITNVINNIVLIDPDIARGRLLVNRTIAEDKPTASSFFPIKHVSLDELKPVRNYDVAHVAPPTHDLTKVETPNIYIFGVCDETIVKEIGFRGLNHSYQYMA